MQLIPVDVSRLEAFAIGEIKTQTRAGQAMPERDILEQWKLEGGIIEDPNPGRRPERTPVSSSRGGFSKDLALPQTVVPQDIGGVAWEKKGNFPSMAEAKSVQVEGGSFRLWGALA